MALDLNGNKVYTATVGPKGEALRSLVTDSIALHLDASNLNSYPGSGTTWTDLNGGSYSTTMYGTVSLVTDVVKCWDFSSVGGGSAGSATLGFTFAGNPLSQTGNFTLSCWIKNPPASSGQVGLFSNAGGADGYRFGVGLNGIYYLIGPTYQEGTITFLSNISATAWYNVAAVFNRSGTNISLYLNGVFQNSTSIPSQSAYSSGVPGIVRSPCCGLYTGKLATFTAYNRVLTSSEISQNFYAQKSRFGL